VELILFTWPQVFLYLELLVVADQILFAIITREPIILPTTLVLGYKPGKQLHPIIIILDLSDNQEVPHVGTAVWNRHLACACGFSRFRHRRTQSFEELVADTAISLTRERSWEAGKGCDQKIGHEHAYTGEETNI
jgi:hypothetical protein